MCNLWNNNTFSYIIFFVFFFRSIELSTLTVGSWKLEVFSVSIWYLLIVNYIMAYGMNRMFGSYLFAVLLLLLRFYVFRYRCFCNGPGECCSKAQFFFSASHIDEIFSAWFCVQIPYSIFSIQHRLMLNGYLPFKWKIFLFASSIWFNSLIFFLFYPWNLGCCLRLFTFFPVLTKPWFKSILFSWKII